MKCKRCWKAEAAVDLPSHHSAFCPECFFVFFRRQVEEGIRKLTLLSPADRVLVCVSGGKDSLVLWDILMELGYRTEGLHIDLGIDGYSERSLDKSAAYAASRGKELIVADMRAEGVPIPGTARRARKDECSVCGTVKRYFFNRVAAERGFTAVATGHNLDDEAARLLGNVLHWDGGHLRRQHPLLPGSDDGLVKKVKPLWRVSEMETAAYGFLKGIDYVTEECPLSADATSLIYKEALSLIEDKMPGTRRHFYRSFLKNRKAFEYIERNDTAVYGNPVMSEDVAENPSSAAGGGEAGSAAPRASASRKCMSCGAPTYMEVCGFCRLKRSV